MNIRPTEASVLAQIRQGILLNTQRMVRNQEQVATGKRILRPSDDPIGAARALELRDQLASNNRFTQAVDGGRTMLDTASSALLDAVGLVSEARAITLQGMNGTVSDAGREQLAAQIDLIREQVLDIANARSGGRYLFAGTNTDDRPFEETLIGGAKTVAYTGNDDVQELLIGIDVRIGVTMPGSNLFSDGRNDGTSIGDRTGLASGSSPDQGTGYSFIDVRHESTTTTLGAGIQLVSGGALDTIMATHNVVVDGVAGTVQMDNGPVLAIPASGSPEYSDFTVTNEHGAELHLDFTAYTGASTTGDAVGAGSISLDGTTYVPLDFTNTNLELTDFERGLIVHVDTTGIHQSGSEQVSFSGRVNVFDTLQGISEALRNEEGLSTQDVIQRVSLLFDEVDRNHENLVRGTGTLGARSQRLSSLESNYADAEVLLRDMLSKVEDADLSEVVLEMAQAENSLQVTQAASARLLQNSLLNFIR